MTSAVGKPVQELPPLMRYGHVANDWVGIAEQVKATPGLWVPLTVEISPKALAAQASKITRGLPGCPVALRAGPEGSWAAAVRSGQLYLRFTPAARNGKRGAR